MIGGGQGRRCGEEGIGRDKERASKTEIKVNRETRMPGRVREGWKAGRSR
jgi:hypothetical protein